MQPLGRQPRTLIAPARHRLAGRSEVQVAEVLDETFISYHPGVQPAWAGFGSLDDHRGGPPARSTADNVRTPSEMLFSMTAWRGVTAVPACDAAVIVKVLREVVAIPVVDAEPGVMSLIWRSDRQNPLVAALAAAARSLVDDVARSRAQ
jgi:DNA-binding transcriptional LysR family regulator